MKLSDLFEKLAQINEAAKDAGDYAFYIDPEWCRKFRDAALDLEADVDFLMQKEEK